jgi:hypothetical protein
MYVDGAEIIHDGLIRDNNTALWSTFYEYKRDDIGAIHKVAEHSVPGWFFSGKYKGCLKCSGHIYEWRE